YALAHVFLPNLLKLKGHAAVVSAIERRDLAYFEPLWAQAHIAHRPHLTSQVRDPYYIATIVVKAADPAFMRYFTLEHDFVLAKQSNRTLLCEREGQKHNKRGDGPVLTGNPGDDAGAFVDCFMELMIPTKVTRK